MEEEALGIGNVDKPPLPSFPIFINIRSGFIKFVDWGVGTNFNFRGRGSLTTI